MVEHYLPHQSVVIVGFDLAGVDQFSLEGSEARPFGDAAFVCEHSAMGQVPPVRLQDGQPWKPQSELNLNYDRDFTRSSCRG